MSASVHETPRGVEYFDGYGGGMEITLRNEGVEVSVSDSVEEVVLTIPDYAWAVFCRRFVRGQDYKPLVFKDRVLLNAGKLS